jgi:hypothetical protein
MKDFLK